MNSNNSAFNIQMTFRNTEGTEPIKSHISEKLTHNLQKFIHHDSEVHVVLTVEKNRHIAEISFNSEGTPFIAKEQSGDLYSSIDAAVHSITNQLRKHKEKLVSKR